MPTFGWMGSVLTVMIGGAHSRFRAPCHASLVTQRAHGHGARVSGERTRAMAIGAFAAISAAMAVAAGAFGAHGASGPQEAEWLRSEEHTSELQSLMRISYAVFCLKKKNTQ